MNYSPYYRKIEGCKKNSSPLENQFDNISGTSERNTRGELAKSTLVIRSTIHATLPALNNKWVAVVCYPDIVSSFKHIQIVVIEQIESLSPELQLNPLRDGHVLAHSCVKVPRPRPIKRVPVSHPDRIRSEVRIGAIQNGSTPETPSRQEDYPSCKDSRPIAPPSKFC